MQIELTQFRLTISILRKAMSINNNSSNANPNSDFIPDSKVTKNYGILEPIVTNNKPQRLKSLGSNSSKIKNKSKITKCHSPEKKITKEWIGLVTDISEKIVYLDLKDKYDTNKVATNTGNLPISELSKSDQKKLSIGSIIDLTIWIKRYPNGKQEEFLNTFVREAPKITPKEMCQALKRAKNRLKGYSWHDTS